MSPERLRIGGGTVYRAQFSEAAGLQQPAHGQRAVTQSPALSRLLIEFRATYGRGMDAANVDAPRRQLAPQSGQQLAE